MLSRITGTGTGPEDAQKIGASAPGAPPAAGVDLGGEVVLLFGVTLLLLIAVGVLLQQLHLRVKILGRAADPITVGLTELVAILAPTILWTRARRPGMLSRLWWPAGRGGQAPWPAQIGGGLLLGAGWFYLIARFVAPLLERLTGPVAEAEFQHLLRLLVPATGLRPLPVDILCFAALPALCEEILFRGALQPRLRQAAAGWLRQRALQPASRARMADGLALLATSALFGLFHLSPAKILPTAVLGLGFGAAAILSGSLLPAILMHLCNNALVIALCRAGLRDPPAAATPLLAILALVVLGVGALLCRRAGGVSSWAHTDE